MCSDVPMRFGIINCNSVINPINTRETLQLEDKEELANAKKYKSLVEGLIYLTHIRSNIAFSVGVIVRFMQKPLTTHLSATKRILRYIARTFEYDLWYGKSSKMNLEDHFYSYFQPRFRSC